MKRLLFSRLEGWQKETKRKPLVLLGARQVGKTYLLQSFADRCFKANLYINFEEDPSLAELFKSSLKPEKLLESLSVYFNRNIDIKDTLIIFDEIQECPEALNSLKYFCEEMPKAYIVAAGSLLGLKMKRAKGFPVGKVTFLHLYPLNFFEFLFALGEEKLGHFLQGIKKVEPLLEPLHEKAINLFKQYLYIGGMPEAVQKYLETRRFQDVRDVQKSIIKAYEFDFAKHVPPQLIMRVTDVWHSMPEQLAKENKKFVFSVVREGARGREYDEAIQWLIDANLLYRVTNISVPQLPLPAYQKGSAYKLYVNDVGLLGAMSNLDSSLVIKENDLFKEFKGALIENFVASQLVPIQENKLHYWTSGNTAEVDFVLQTGSEVYPMEVKAGVSSKKKSLQVYAERYKPKKMIRVSPMNLRHDGILINYPLYLMERYPL